MPERRKDFMSTTQPIKSVKQLEQFKKYYQEVSPDSRNYALIILGLNTALRISDILRLHIADVWDFRQHCFNRHIEITERKTGKDTSIYIKTRRSGRLYPHATLPAWIQVMLFFQAISIKAVP